MNPTWTGMFWFQLMAVLIAESALILGVAEGLSRRRVRGSDRRVVWLAGALSLGLILIVELTGLSGFLGADQTGESGSHASGTIPSAKTDGAELRAGFRWAVAERVGREVRAEAPSGAKPFEVSAAQDIVWPVWLWVSGAFLVLLRSGLGRLLCWRWARGGEAVGDDGLARRIDELAQAQRWRGRIRLLRKEGLMGPVVLGLRKPVIGLPARFQLDYSEAQQEVMLAHEVAHIANRDLLWQFMVEIVAALWWWNPAIWWARRQLARAMEEAADEASLLVANGPGLLASALVKLGRQLGSRRDLPWMAAGGVPFTSDLGRRVQRLLCLESGVASQRGAHGWWRFCGPLLITGAIVVVPATANLNPINKGDTPMKRVHLSLKRSITALAVSGLITTNSFSADTLKNANRPTAASDAAGVPDSGGAGAGEFQWVTGMALGSGGREERRESEGIAVLQEMLVTIRFEEVAFDRIPLGEVLKYLEKQVRERNGAPINFLISNAVSPENAAMGAVDPLTGLPLVAEVVDLEQVLVNFNLPLRQVRLKDVLDAIVKVAEKPLRYSVEEFGILFTADPGRTAAKRVENPIILEVRTFQVDTNTFLPALESAFGIPSKPASAGKGTARFLKNELRGLLLELGVNLDVPGKVVFYSEHTGMLMVRATAADLATVQAAIETLGGMVGR